MAAKLTEAELNDLFTKCDSNNDKVLDLDEFSNLVAAVEKGNHRSKEDLEKLFKEVDKNG